MEAVYGPGCQFALTALGDYEVHIPVLPNGEPDYNNVFSNGKVHIKVLNPYCVTIKVIKD